MEKVKKVGKIIKKNKMLLVGIIIIGGVIFGGGVYASTVASSSVSYNNSSSGISSTNVQGAIDKLYKKAKTHCPDGYECTKLHYAFGKPTTSSTSDYTTLRHNVFVRLKETGELGVCIIRNKKLFCMNNNDYDNSKAKLIKEFGEATCSVSSSDVRCNASDFSCGALQNGIVGCTDNSVSSTCNVLPVGSVNCN